MFPPAHCSFNILRMAFSAMAGAVTVAEVHAYINNRCVCVCVIQECSLSPLGHGLDTFSPLRDCLKFGQQSSVVTLILVTEILLYYKVFWGLRIFCYNVCNSFSSRCCPFS